MSAAAYGGERLESGDEAEAPDRTQTLRDRATRTRHKRRLSESTSDRDAQLAPLPETYDTSAFPDHDSLRKRVRRPLALDRAVDRAVTPRSGPFTAPRVIALISRSVMYVGEHGEKLYPAHAGDFIGTQWADLHNEFPDADFYWMHLHKEQPPAPECPAMKYVLREVPGRLLSPACAFVLIDVCAGCVCVCVIGGIRREWFAGKLSGDRVRDV